MEIVLSSKINDCLQNDQFSMIPIPSIYRIIEKCDMKKLSQNLLYDFIKKDLPKHCFLFNFLNIRHLSDEKFKDLYELYSNADELQKSYFGYLECNLEHIAELKDFHQKEMKQINELQNSIQKVEQERDNLIQNDKAYFDHIRDLIPYKNDDERINIVDRDVHFSNDVRSLFSNSSDNEILSFISKDINLASGIRNFFKSGDDSWIRNQIEENHNQIPVLKESISNLQKEKNNMQSQIIQI